jgi:peptidyl-Lys metalloendopeptidase
MQQVWLVVCITIVVMLAHGCANQVSVSVTPTSSRYTAKQKVQFTLKYKNNGPDTAYIYRWAVPNGELQHPLFTVTQNGKKVQYLGLLAKRAPPSAADAISLASGKEISATIDLSQAYDISKSGKYTVQFEMPAKHLFHTSSSNSETQKTSSNEADESVLQSEPVTVFAEARSNTLIKNNQQSNTQQKSLSHTDIGCSSSRQSAINAAIAEASKYADASKLYLEKNLGGTSRYTTWFGTYSSAHFTTVKNQYINISSVFTTKSITFDCSTCTMSNVYAYVYPSMPYKIYLCSVFWMSPVSGTDSKAGTIIHELSHFTVVAGTQDNAYGQTACKALAKANPTKAINNADSHEYFSENTPTLT